MKKQCWRFTLMSLSSVLLTAVSGCLAPEENVVAEFISDFARNALAAFLL